MRLLRLYCNKPDVFGPIDFREGLNVVLAEIRLPENKNRDTHNLGKTTLGRMIDFCFLAERDKEFFLFKHEALFIAFVFFMEVGLPDGSYLTVRRSVAQHSKICFKKHQAARQDFSALSDEAWDHVNLPFERARELLDSLLDWRAVAPWDFRKGLGYQLRSQEDYQDVFQLRNFAVGKHKHWKPYAAHVLGFEHRLIDEHYAKLEEIEKKEQTEAAVRVELGGSVEGLSKIDGILLLKQDDARKKQQLLDAFDFRQQDQLQTDRAVDELEVQIAELNTRRYSLSHARRRILTSLEEDHVLFRPDQAERLFREVGVLFPAQVKKDFSQLIAFNRAISEERRGFLQEELAEIDSELNRVASELDRLGQRRTSVLKFLSSADIFVKYKWLTDEVVSLRADIAQLEKQRGYVRRLQALRAEIRSLTEECGRLQSRIEADVEAQHADSASLFSIIRLYFSDIVEIVTGHKALLRVTPNKYGHLEFKAEILDERGTTTSADRGHTYRKLLCIAFDLATVRANLGRKFPRFVYLDGVFESLDDRKKSNLLDVLRQYAEFGVQTVITLIDSDLPPTTEGGDPVFAPEEIILTLHDEGPEGRLFRMPAW